MHAELEPNNPTDLQPWLSESPQEESHPGLPGCSNQFRRETIIMNSTLINANTVSYAGTSQHPHMQRQRSSDEDRLKRSFSGSVIRSAIPTTRDGDKELKYIPGTFDKLLVTIGKHISHPHSSSRVLLVHGSVGAGKSALLKEVYVQNDKSLIAFFFHAKDNRHNCTHVMPTLVDQLSSLIPDVKSHLSVVRETHLKAASMCKQFQGFILNAFRVNPQLRDTFAILLDGIDICPPDDQEDLFRLVKEGARDGFRFIISCRKRLRDLPMLSTEWANEVSIDRESGRAAVRRCLAFELEKVWEAKANLVHKCPALDATVVDELAEEADGQMLFASSIATYVGTPGTAPGQRLQDARKGVFVEVDERYHDILIRYVQGSGGEQKWREVLSVVVALFRPQPIHVIARLAGLEDADVNLVVDSLPGLLARDGATFCISLAYKSFRKFLTNKKRSKNFCIGEHQAHLYILKNINKTFPSAPRANEPPARRPSSITALDLAQRYLSEWFLVHCVASRTAQCSSDTRMLIDLMVALDSPHHPGILADVLGIPLEETNKFLPLCKNPPRLGTPRIKFPIHLFKSSFHDGLISSLTLKRRRRLITLGFRVLSNACQCAASIFDAATLNSPPSPSAVEFILQALSTRLSISPQMATQRLCTIEADEVGQHVRPSLVTPSPCRLYFWLEALCGELISYIPTDHMGDLRRIVGVIATSHRPLSQASLARILELDLKSLQNELLRYPALFNAPLPDTTAVQLSLKYMDNFLDNLADKQSLDPPFNLANYHHLHLAAIDSGRTPTIENIGEVVRHHYAFCTPILQHNFLEGIRKSLQVDSAQHIAIDGRRYRFLVAILGLGNLPVDLSDAIVASLDSIGGNCKQIIAGSAMPSPAKVLGVLLVSTQPLSAGDMHSAADMDCPLGELSASLDALKPLVEVSGDPESPRFCLSDVSREFLLDAGRAGEYLVDQQACHDVIALQDVKFRSLLIRFSFPSNNDWDDLSQSPDVASFGSVLHADLAPLTNLKQHALTCFTDDTFLEQARLGLFSSLVNCDTHYRACSEETLASIASLVNGVTRAAFRHYGQRCVSPLSFQLLLDYYAFLSAPLQSSNDSKQIGKSMEGLRTVLQCIAPTGQSVMVEKDRRRLLKAMYRVPGLGPRTSSLLDLVFRQLWKGEIIKELAKDAKRIGH